MLKYLSNTVKIDSLHKSFLVAKIRFFKLIYINFLKIFSEYFIQFLKLSVTKRVLSSGVELLQIYYKILIAFPNALVCKKFLTNCNYFLMLNTYRIHKAKSKTVINNF